MKTGKPSRPRSKLNFAVDRSEIDISSDWVQAVMDRRTTATVAANTTDEFYSPVATRDPVVSTASGLRVIRCVPDALTPGQMAVYQAMFSNGEPEGQGSRLYRGGYADIRRITGMSKRGIQNIIAELQRKFVIGIHKAPGYHKSQTTTYRIHAQAQILADWRQRGIQFAQGKGKTLIIPATVASTASVDLTATV